MPEQSKHKKKKRIYVYSNSSVKKTAAVGLAAAGFALVFDSFGNKNKKHKKSFVKRTNTFYKILNGAVFSAAANSIYKEFLAEKHPDFMNNYKKDHIKVEKGEFIDI